jgi:hypothetical protein
VQIQVPRKLATAKIKSITPALLIEGLILMFLVLTWSLRFDKNGKFATSKSGLSRNSSIFNAFCDFKAPEKKAQTGGEADIPSACAIGAFIGLRGHKTHFKICFSLGPINNELSSLPGTITALEYSG